MFEESRTEFLLRWYLYRWRKRNPRRVAERLFYKVMDDAPRHGVFVDLGANFGLVTAKALEYGHKVYAFEPDPFPLSKLRQRFGGNPNVEIIPKAIGATARSAKLFRQPDVEIGAASEGSSLIETAVHADGATVDIEVVDIVGFLRSLPAPPVAVKMDVEGAEAECLEAILDAGLHRSIGMLLVETHDRFSPELAARLDAIRARIARERIDNINLEWI